MFHHILHYKLTHSTVTAPYMPVLFTPCDTFEKKHTPNPRTLLLHTQSIFPTPDTWFNFQLLAVSSHCSGRPANI